VTPSDHQVARAVARVEPDRSIGVAEASTLLCARDKHLDRMTAEARRVRDAGLVAAGRPVG
jgi:FO synthase